LYDLHLAVRIFWSFDNTLEDLYNNFNGIGINSPIYRSPGYNGAGACLYLNKTMQQSVTIFSPPFLNMTYASFTFQVWMYAQTLCNNTDCDDNAIFGQYQQLIEDSTVTTLLELQYINNDENHLNFCMHFFFRYCILVNGIILYVSEKENFKY
jgi:hypothetical protein